MDGSVLDEMKTDALCEIYNVAMGSAASAVSTMLDTAVSITAPAVTVCKASEIVRTKLKQTVKDILFNKGEECVYVKVDYIKGVTGTSVFVFNRENMQMIVSSMMGMPMAPDENFQFDEMAVSAVTEFMNQMLGCAATSMSQFINSPVEISPPETVVSAETKTLYKMQGIAASDEICALAFEFKAGEAFDSRFIMLIPVQFAVDLANKLMGIDPEDEAEEAETESESGNDISETENEFESGTSGNVISEHKRDAIGEIQNIMMGSAATALSNFMSAKVWITTPEVQVTKAGYFNFDDLDPSICVRIKYIKGIHGASVLVLKQSDVQLMVNQLMGLPPVVTDDFEFNEMNISAVCEIMNQMMGASATTLSEIICTPTDISTPEAIVIDSVDDILKINNISSDDEVCAISFDLTIDGIINSRFVTMLSIDLANEMADKMLASYSSELEDYSEEIGSKSGSEPELKSTAPASAEPPRPAPASPKPEKQKEQPKSKVSSSPVQTQPLKVERFEMEPLEDEVDPASFLNERQYSNLRSLLDVPMEVSVRIGSTQRSIDEVGNFTRGTIIELDTLANEPVDIMVNGNLIAKGDVVVVDDNFAVRITEIIK